MKKILITYSPQQPNLKRLSYVLDFLNRHPLNKNCFFSRDPLTDPTIRIAYGTSDGDYLIKAQGLFFSKQTIDFSELYANAFRFEEQILYSVEKEKRTEQAFIRDRNFSLDIFETIFFHISRFEEVFAEPKNNSQAGWLKENLHFLIRNGLEQRPIVDQLVKAFLKSLGDNLAPRSTSYDLSHDVDILTRFRPFSKFLKSLAATVVYRRGLDQLRRNIKYFRAMQSGKKKDPYDTFHYLLRHEPVWQDKVLYLMAGGNTKYDNKYQLRDKGLDIIIDLAKKKGYRFGLHPSYNAGFEPKRYQSEKQALEEKLKQPIVLNRQHWLRFDWQITTEIFSTQNIKRDATMAYNRYLGFRCGTGFAYYMYDFKNEKSFSWLEQPMAFMESSAIHQAKISGKPLATLMKDFLEKNKYDTHISFNFHNSNFDPLLPTGRLLEDFYKNDLIDIIG